MPICEECGRQFDALRAAGQFITEANALLPVSYEKFNRYLCGDCSLAAYENGQYSETCEFCGKAFFPDEELILFALLCPHAPAGDMYRFGVRCANCAACLL